MITALFTWLLTSCSPADTIAPEESTATAREATSILNSDDFEGKKFGAFWLPEVFTTFGSKLVTDVRRSGKQAIRFAWKPSQANGTSPMLRAELATHTIPAGEVAERWYGYSSFLPSASMANDNKTAIISQWHGMPDDNVSHTVPPAAISVEPGNRLQLMYFASTKPITKPMQHPTSKKILDLGPATFDRWVDYVVHVKWDATGKTGLIEIWQDGKKIVDERNISIGYPELRQPYWKMGLYCWTGQSLYEEKSVYYDEVRIGGPAANYDVVKPGRNDNTARPRL